MKKILLTTLCVLGLSLFAWSQCNDYDVIVAQDGSGDFLTVQDAIDAAPSNATEPHVIYIKNGEYDEKIYIEKPFLTFIGESRYETIIKTAELRRIWRETNPSDWGAATVNLTDSATDILFANMTLLNNFAEVFPDTPDPNDHTFTIRGGGDRVILINCDIISTGGDTCALWNNSNDGMYYHRGCFFTGWVDYLCPRGFCYVEGCDFFGYNNNASLWHDGSDNEEHKFVLRDCVFDGVIEFALGRYHLDGHFFLLDNYFTKPMRNKAIYHVDGADPLQWGERVYYYNCHKDKGDYPWHLDNLSDSGISDPDEITAQWTFQNSWDPESLIIGVMPFASLPRPINGKLDAPLSQDVEWVAGRCVVSHDVYFGTDPDNLNFMGNQEASSFDPGDLEECTPYFWRIDEITEDGETIPGEVWAFTTEIVSPPAQVTNPRPEDESTAYGSQLWLKWDADLEKTDSFYVYFGKEGEMEYLNKTAKDSIKVSFLDPGSIYEWRIDARNHIDVTEGEPWSFLYGGSSGIFDLNPNAREFIKSISPNPVTDQAILEFELPKSGKVRIDLMDMQGRTMKSIRDERMASGTHILSFSISGLSSGMHFCRMKYEGKTEIIKLFVD
ncbi:MAG: T9SS type A sorting domain-containing protein [Bacteroidetes bacterium]|nr:T9SS type A sorting domain-containing protein [Bacteroidota bacterium]